MGKGEEMTDCPTCEYHKQRAQIWRDEAYKLAGHPLPERDPVLEEREACAKLLETTDLGGLKDNPAMQSWVAEMLLAYVKAIRARGQA
jgi:hypothetical protein